MNSLRHLLIQEFKLQPGGEWMSTAACWRFLHISIGESYWLGPPRARSLAEGEVLVIAPAVHAIIRASQLTEVRLRGFAFVPENLVGFFTLAERQIFENALVANTEPVRFFPSTHPVTRRFAALVSPNPGCTALGQRAEALGVVAAVFDPKATIRHEPEPLWASSIQRFQQLISVLPDVEIINYSTGELARLCGCSLRHFNYMFRKQFGASVRDRQAELRLLKACQCLRNTDPGVSVVAQDCGFQSVEKFNFLFKKRFGVAPSEWRQREQAADYETSISNPLESSQMTTGENRAIRVLHRH